MTEFFSPSQILAVNDGSLPQCERSFNRLVAKQGWRSTDKAKQMPSRGRGWLYHKTLFSDGIQARLSLGQLPGEKVKNSSDLWGCFEQLPKKQKDECQRRLQVLNKVERLVEAGLSRTAAMNIISDEVSVSFNTLVNWFGKVKNSARTDWLPLLAPSYKKTASRVDCHPDAYTALKSDYALLTSDGTTGLLITRTGASKAPADLKLPGNVLDASASFTEKGRHSETIVIGQAEALDGDRKDRKASQSPSQGAKRPEDRQATDGSATTRERRGTAITRRIRDEEVKDHRPKVHLAKGLTTAQATQDEADWRQRTARGEAEDTTYQVRGFDVNGSLWHANQIVGVDDAFLGIKRDMVISAINYSYKEEVETTSLTVSSPESFDNQPTGSRRSNTSTSKNGGASTGLDGLANRL